MRPIRVCNECEHDHNVTVDRQASTEGTTGRAGTQTNPHCRDLVRLHEVLTASPPAVRLCSGRGGGGHYKVMNTDEPTASLLAHSLIRDLLNPIIPQSEFYRFIVYRRCTCCPQVWCVGNDRAIGGGRQAIDVRHGTHCTVQYLDVLEDAEARPARLTRCQLEQVSGDLDRSVCELDVRTSHGRVVGGS